VKVRVLLAVRISHDVENFAVVHTLRPVFGIPDDLVNEIAQVKNESDLFRLACPLIFENHPPVSVLSSLIRVLAAYKDELHWTHVRFFWRGDRPPNAASFAKFVGESVPIHVTRFQPTYKHAAGVIGISADRRIGGGYHVLELFVFGDLDMKFVDERIVDRGAASPQQDAVAVGIA